MDTDKALPRRSTFFLQFCFSPYIYSSALSTYITNMYRKVVGDIDQGIDCDIDSDIDGEADSAIDSGTDSQIHNLVRSLLISILRSIEGYRHDDQYDAGEKQSFFWGAMGL